MGDCNSFILSGLWGIDGRVLIVPSGIETFIKSSLPRREAVLIVPSGIETRFCFGFRVIISFVLIVPSGIETEEDITIFAPVASY